MSNFNFLDLKQDVRQLMLSEINNDINSGKLYISKKLNPQGAELYQSFLLEAARNGNAESFQNTLESGGYFNPTYIRQGKIVKMPSNSAQLLAGSEFNRFYIRGVCLKAIQRGQNTVEVYRARESNQSRPESETKIGRKINAKELLDDLRNSIGTGPKILPEINSGLSAKL